MVAAVVVVQSAPSFVFEAVVEQYCLLYLDCLTDSIVRKTTGHDM